MGFAVGVISTLAVIAFLVWGFFSTLGNKKNIGSIVVVGLMKFFSLFKRKK